MLDPAPKGPLPSPAARLRAVVPGCHDALGARLIARGAHPGPDRLLPFKALYDIAGFNAYYAMQKRYAEQAAAWRARSPAVAMCSPSRDARSSSDSRR